MKPKELIESGMLELYVMGMTGVDESAEIERMASLYPEVQAEIRAISTTLEEYARQDAKEPDPTVLPFLLATMDYMTRMEKGETPANPPMLHERSRIEDYAEWLERPDLQLDRELDDAHARIIAHTPQALTAIVWLKDGSPEETHTAEYERFLIVEGSCEISIAGEVHSLQAGDVLSIPLYKSHVVKVTSACPCKIILQRVAA